MDIDLKLPDTMKVVQEAFFFRHTLELAVDRPVQAWQWMNQTRSIPDQCDWVRQEVLDAWRRCLEDYQLPLGKFASHPPLKSATASCGQNLRRMQEITRLLAGLSPSFDTFLKNAGIVLVLADANGSLRHTLGENVFVTPFLTRHDQSHPCWNEMILGNNGIGSAAALKKPIAFQGMEHFLSVLHPFTTIGYPLLDAGGELLAVVGLISDHQESMNSLFAFLHLICVLLNTNLPLTQSEAAQARVLEKIPFKPLNKSLQPAGTALSEDLQALVNKAVKLQRHKIPILITGESGVGKDHFVNLLKNAGPRQNQPLIAINCASIPHELIESELFGYEAGSFTGAKSQGKPGKFLLADKGILFLDEIGDMSLDLQTTLLRVLETSEFTPVGGTKPIRVDVQIVAATHVQLPDAVEAGRFRRDLYYRLNGAQIHLLPLRDRRDKKAIIHCILQRELTNMPDGETIDIHPEVIDLIEKHPWPGNIRQLINVLRATLYTAGNNLITRDDLPLDFFDVRLAIDSSSYGTGRRADEPSGNGAMRLEDWEIHGIRTALLECQGNISLAAKKLGITRTTLYKKIDRFGLNKMGLAS